VIRNGKNYLISLVFVVSLKRDRKLSTCYTVNSAEVSDTTVPLAADGSRHGGG
jgi:hypothetical protein